MVIAATMQVAQAPMTSTGVAVPAATAATATTAASPHAWVTTMPQASSDHSNMEGFVEVPMEESLAMQGPAGDSQGSHSSLIASHGDESSDVPMWPAGDHAGPVTARSRGTTEEADGVASAAHLDLFGMD